MTRVTCDIAVSMDGYSSGPHQRLEAPLGDGVLDALHGWMFEHEDENEAEVAGILGAGAYIMGRNMFGPIRGEWAGDWRGWWGDEPPYRAPVFVLTNHPREPLEMAGGTIFHFVTSGPQAAMDAAREAAGDRDVSIAGGASTINQFLSLGLIDELRLHIVPSVLGLGTYDEHVVRIWDGVPAGRWRVASSRSNDHVLHVTYVQQG